LPRLPPLVAAAATFAADFDYSAYVAAARMPPPLSPHPLQSTSFATAATTPPPPPHRPIYRYCHCHAAFDLALCPLLCPFSHYQDTYTAETTRRIQNKF
jgi:hypothetical protein